MQLLTKGRKCCIKAQRKNFPFSVPPRAPASTKKTAISKIILGGYNKGTFF